MNYYDLTAYGELLATNDCLIDVEYLTSESTIVKGVTYNSKEIEPGFLFICKGAKFKESYLLEAVERGAIGYVSEKKYEVADSIASLIVKNVRESMPYIADLFFNSPAKKLKIVAVGGTKGKTTTTYYIKAIIDAYLKKHGKKPSGFVSSVNIYDGLADFPASNTTPESIVLQRYLANAVEAGLEYMVLEVSSQALKYNRVDMIDFDVGVFLNISDDHISPIEHESFEDYFTSKMQMFKQTKYAAINFDSKEYEEVLEQTKNTKKTFNYSVKSDQADFYGYNVSTSITGSHFRIKGPNFDEDFEISMPGFFNVENALAAVTATFALNIPYEFAIKGLKNIRVPGRMERWESKDGLLTVIVDYAHNKVSYEKLYPVLRKYYPDAHLIAVFGSAGGKAFNRRKGIGETVGKYADEAILTMYNPDMEEQSDINQDIAPYIEQQNVPVKRIDHRGDAIREAILTTTQKTIVVITGRGSEKIQKIKGELIELPSDIEYVKQYLKEYDEKHS